MNASPFCQYDGLNYLAGLSGLIGMCLGIVATMLIRDLGKRV
jgi:hypothetical protein